MVAAVPTEPSSDLPKGWHMLRFPDALSEESFRVGKVKRSEYQPTGTYPVVDQGQGLIAGYWDDPRDVYDGTLPVVVFGDHTRAFKYVDFSFVCGADGTKVLVPDRDRFDPRFLYFALLGVPLPSRGYNRHFKLLREQVVPQPPLAEQRTISHVLLAVQRAKEQTEQVIAATREVKRGLLNTYFGHAQSVGSGEVSRWPQVELRSLIAKPEYGYTASAVEKPVGPHLLRITDIQDDRVVWETVPFCECSPADRQKFLLAPGDLLVARIGATTGKTYLVHETPSDAVFASYLIRVRTLGRLDPRFLSYFTQSASYWSQINAEKGGRLKQGVNTSTLTRLQLPCPDVDEQGRVVSTLEALDKKLEAERQRSEALAVLFSSLLDDLMTGRLRVNHLLSTFAA